MPRSMTGYGAASAAGSRIRVEIEVRSVNARSLKVSLRTPAALSPHEADLEALVRDRVRRGTVSLSARVDYLRPQEVLRIRTDLVEGLAKSIEALRRKGVVEGKLTPDAVAAFPGAIETGAQDPLRPADWKVVAKACNGALDGLDAMRRREATHLVRDLRALTRDMRARLREIATRAPEVVVEHHARLRERVDALLRESGVRLDDSTLAREVALLADRSDVNEEVTRLSAHLEEFDAYLGRDGVEVGRPLDFLAQEMLRETNTIGSKSQDVAISRAVIALKSAVDRLKEQVANLE